MQRLICLILGYAFGLIQTGYIIGRIKGIDIRNYGSKNAGTTNVLRTMGAKYAIMVLLGDALKCVLAVTVTYFLFKDSYPDTVKLLELYSACGTIIGHNYPVHMHFRGGKGIASTAGLVISMGWFLTFLGVATFFTTYFLTHYVSLGSILVYVGLIIEVIILGQLGKLGFPPDVAPAVLYEYYALIIFLAFLAWFRHKENIKRLLHHCERKTYILGKPEIDVNNKDAEPNKDVINPAD